VPQHAGAGVWTARPLVVDRAELQHRATIRDVQREVEILLDDQHAGAVAGAFVPQDGRDAVDDGRLQDPNA